MQRAALISVTDKTGVVDFAKGLVDLGFKILSSSGTATTLKENNVPVVMVEDYTGSPEILDGRVKTLHPKIHGGLLAKRSDANHLAQMEQHGILPIDVVVVNLYPFLNKVQGPEGKDPASMVNFIDIGGPAMLRAASKNHEYVLPVIDPADYSAVLSNLKDGDIPLSFRRKLASKVFMTLANYDLQIAKYYSEVAASEGKSCTSSDLNPISGVLLERAQELRYGENPHQSAHLYRDVNRQGEASWKQLHGKSLSYNNLLDFDATLRLMQDLKDQPAAAIFKHLNPCGVGIADSLLTALQLAKKGDPRSHFGGVIGFTREVTEDVAADLTDGFVEIVLAPKYSVGAMNVLTKRKNLRIIEVNLNAVRPLSEIRVIQDGILIQEPDRKITSPQQGKVVSKRTPTPEEYEALDFAWKVCAHVKSNAIVLGDAKMILGVGAGQMSRVDSAELAISRAALHGNSLKGAVAASDAFFPFPDSVEKLIGAGVSAVVAPSGATRDDEVIETADRLGIALVFMDERHFRH
jgi:phosphoribosylaminoimidazolecarboxamide formyltransferase/IMP cyclohydrolase